MYGLQRKFEVPVTDLCGSIVEEMLNNQMGIVIWALLLVILFSTHDNDGVVNVEIMVVEMESLYTLKVSTLSHKVLSIQL